MHSRELLKLSIVGVVLVIAVLVLWQVEKTGLVAGEYTVNLNILEKTDGRLIVFDFRPVIFMNETQTISTEFKNTGTTSYTAQITLKLNNLTNLTIVPVASYFDSTVSLTPGGRRSYKTVFVPPNPGIYLIQARVLY